MKKNNKNINERLEFEKKQFKMLVEYCYEGGMPDTLLNEEGDEDEEMPTDEEMPMDNEMPSNDGEMAPENDMPMDDNEASTDDEMPMGEEIPADEEMSMDDEMPMDGEMPMGDTEMEGDTVIDVDQLTDAQEKTNTNINNVGLDIVNVNNKINQLLDKIVKMSDAIDVTDKKIVDLKVDLEKRNPTDIEKLNLRLKDSYPFNVTPEKYWDKVTTEKNYDINNDEEEYIIRKEDIDDNDASISKTFGIDKAINIGMKDIFN